MATITVDTKARRHAEERASRGLWRDAFRRLLRNGPAVVGLVLISIFVFTAIFAPVIAPYGPLQGSLADRLQPPSPQHIMGTDLQGRDEYSRILYGAQVSLVVAVGSVIMALIFGGLIGAFAGAAGGKVDNVLMRIVDVLLSIPGILLAIGIVAWLGRGLPQIMLAVALTNTPIFARILRGSLLANRDLDYVNAARSLGAGRLRTLGRHMLPNSLTALIVAATLALATAIIDVAGLGFLGLGPPDPRTPEWGTMLTDSTKFLRSAPVPDPVPGHRDRDQRDRVQPARRRPARIARPAAEALTPMTLLSVEDLVVRFRTRESVVHAVNGVTFELEEGERLGLVGESGLRQERHQPRDHPAAAASRPAGSRAAASCSRGRTSARLDRGRDPRHPGQGHRDDLPGPDDEPEPGAHDRGADGRDDPGAIARCPRPTPGPAPSSSWRWSASPSPRRG